MDAGDWVLCRWMEGLTSLGVHGPEHRSYDKTTGLVVCGPMSRVYMKELDDLGRCLGFPKVMRLARFATPEEADLSAEMKGDHISIDLPAPLDAFHFEVEKYSHYDGSKSFIVENASYEDAEREFALALLRQDPSDHYTKLTMDGAPHWPRLSEFRPSAEQAERILAKERELNAG
jgi:hypothetical protein